MLVMNILGYSPDDIYIFIFVPRKRPVQHQLDLQILETRWTSAAIWGGNS